MQTESIVVSHSTEDPELDVLPTGRVRAAGVAAIIAGVAFLFIGIQFGLFAASPVPVAVLAVEGVIVAIACAYFLVAWGLSSGHAWSAAAAVGLSVVGALVVAYLFFVSGAVSCVLAGSPVTFSFVLSVISVRDVLRMARARSALLGSAR